MKILMVSYFFYPEITPRAFRTFSLAKEFSKEGHDVIVYVPECCFDYDKIKSTYGITVRGVKSGFFLGKNVKASLRSGRAPLDPKTSVKKSKIWKLLEFLFSVPYKMIYVEHAGTEYFLPVFNALRKDQEHYDMLISVALPFASHLGCSLALIINKMLANVRVAEYGDPFSVSKSAWQFRYSGIYKSVERFVLRKFDYITVPTVKMAELFHELKEPSKVKVIPQGFDFSEIKLAEYRKNKVPTFGYAGIFYPKIRNPKKLFEFLSNLEIDFIFHIYTDISESYSMDCIVPFMEELGEKIIVHDSIKREELIYELSKFDFLVNIRYKTDYQLPIKLIDYALAGRPVIELSQDRIDEERLIRFINGIYDNLDDNIELSCYNVKNVAPQFIELACSKNFNCIERCDE